jgi:Tol biopolymer transport system component
VFHSASINTPPDTAIGPYQVYVADLEAKETTVVSSDTDGNQGNGDSALATISANGRFVAYESAASNLVLGDTNGVQDVFVYDRDTGVTRRVSVASNGSEGNGTSFSAVVSDDGVVAFDSEASNLVAGDTNGQVDVFLHDFASGETKRVSVSGNGTEGSGPSARPSISRDGTTVVFTSWADGLVPGDNNGKSDVFAYDVPTGSLWLLSTDALGNPGNGDSRSSSGSVSVDGSWCVFDSVATNLIRRDRNGSVRDVFLVRVR